MKIKDPDYRRALLTNAGIAFILAVSFFDFQNQKKQEMLTLNKAKNLKQKIEQIDAQWQQTLGKKDTKTAMFYKNLADYSSLSEENKKLVDSYNRNEFKKDSIIKSEITDKDIKNFESFKRKNRGRLTYEKRNQEHILSQVFGRTK